MLDISVYYLAGLNVNINGITEGDLNRFKQWVDGMERGSFEIRSNTTSQRKIFRKEGLAFIDVRNSKDKEA